MKLFSKYHVPDIAIQEKDLREKCDEVFDQLNIGVDQKQYFVEPIINSLMLKKMISAGGIFRTPHMRKKFFSCNLSYVLVEVPLQKDNEHNECFYYYVPILGTLKALLCDPHIYNAAFRDKHGVPGYLYDYTDGLKFKNISFFSKKTVNVFIYQYAAEVCVGL